MLMLNSIVWIRTVWLNWMTWNRNVFDNQTVLTFKLLAYSKLNFWNGIVFDIETLLTLKLIVLYRTVLTFNCV